MPLEQMVLSTSRVTKLVFLEMWLLGLKYYPGTSESSYPTP